MVQFAVEHGLFDRHWLERCPLLVGLRADWSFAQHWHLGARLSNAFDEEYSLASGFATPGSELMVTLRWE